MSDQPKVKRTRDDSRWRKLAAETRAKRRALGGSDPPVDVSQLAAWAEETSQPSPGNGGADCLRILLRRWDLYHLPPEIMPEEMSSATIRDLADVLDRVALIEGWHAGRPLESAGASAGWMHRVAQDEAWNRLREYLVLRPVMIPFKTDWKVVLAGSEKGGSFLICDSRQSAQEVGLPEFRRLWSASSNIGLRATGLKREVVSRLDWTVLVPQHQLSPPESLRDRFDKLPEPDGMEDAMKRYADLNPKEFPIPVTERNLRIIGKMLEAIQPGSQYWDYIVRGGLPGYDVYIHELVRAGWCFEQIPPIDPCSIKEADRIYEIEHPLSLIAEHRFLQSLVTNRVLQVTRGSGREGFTIKELVLANPLTEHAQIDWSDIKKFDLEFGRAFLRDVDFEDRPGKVEAAKRWFEDMGYR